MSVTVTEDPAAAGVARPAVLADGIADASVAELLAAAGELLAVAYQRVQEDFAGLSLEVLLDQVVAAQRVQNSAWAVQTHLLAQAAAIEYRDEPNPIENALPKLVTRVIRHAPGSFTDEWFPVEVATGLGWSDRQTHTRLTDALDTLTGCPRLLDRVGAGGLDPAKACAVAQISTDAPDHVAQAIEDKILSTDPEGLTATKVRAMARRVRARLDPVGADQASTARRRSAVGVWVSPHHEPGLSQLTAVLPTLEAAKLMAAIDELARELHQVTTTDKTLPQCRVDALTDLALRGVGVDTQLTFLIPITPPVTPPVSEGPGQIPELSFEEPDWSDLNDAFDEACLDYHWHEDGLEPVNGLNELDAELRALIAGELADLNTTARAEHDSTAPPGSRRPPDEVPAGGSAPWEVAVQAGRLEHAASTRAGHPHCGIGDVLLPRVGVIPAEVITQMTHVLGIKLTRALTDATTGTVIETSDRSYRPGARLARFVRARDQHCRFPGCTRPAKLTDLDHVTRYPDGPTAAHNLQCLCRHHHRAKHEGGWTVTMTPHGVCTWTSPAGHTYTTHPGS
ncbi:HNH endonuclease signature motif containing protein [Branchiibius cervicis]|uniref:HNH endonuclease signature motif containing protein n=1 Tax=Branchiibius cervicis TaxID=908252 RepID=A0ABW2AQS9_9MICO